MKKLRRPGFRIIVPFEDVFDEPILEDRLEYIRGYSRREMLSIFSWINTIDRDQEKFDGALDINYQHRILKELEVDDPKLAFKLFKATQRKAGPDAIPMIFSRAGNMIALEEVSTSDLLSDLKNDEGITGSLSLENVIKYYLAINNYLIEYSGKGFEDYQEGANTWERFSASIAAISEYHETPIPLLRLCRGIQLVHFIRKDARYGEKFTAYFQSQGITPEVYLVWIYQFLDEPMRKIPVNRHLFFRPEDGANQNFYDFFTKGYQIKLRGVSPLEALNIKKTPIILWHADVYLLLDAKCVHDKCYRGFINDFFFDHLKPSFQERPDTYFGMVGRFVEEYVADLLRESFPHLRHPMPLFLNELKFKNGKEEKEFGDFYIRQNKKIILGEIKGGAINSSGKYRIKRDSLFGKSQPEFYEGFGVGQLVEMIAGLRKHYAQFDPKLPVNSRLDLFPVLVVDEKLLNVPVINASFHDFFIKLLQQTLPNIEIPEEPVQMIRYQNFNIHPLVLFGVEDVEIMEPLLASKEIDIWKLLRKHYKETKLHLPFKQTLRINRLPTTFWETQLERVRPILEKLQKKSLENDD